MPFLLSHDIPQRMPSQVLELVQQGTFQGMDSCQGHAKEVVYSSSPFLCSPGLALLLTGRAFLPWVRRGAAPPARLCVCVICHNRPHESLRTWFPTFSRVEDARPAFALVLPMAPPFATRAITYTSVIWTGGCEPWSFCIVLITIGWCCRLALTPVRFPDRKMYRCLFLLLRGWCLSWSRCWRRPWRRFRCRCRRTAGGSCCLGPSGLRRRHRRSLLDMFQGSRLASPAGCRHCRHIERADLADSAFVRNAMLVPDTAAWQVLIAFAMAWSPRHAFVSMVHVFLPTPIQA